MNLQLRHKVIGLAFISALLPALALFLIIFIEQKLSSKRVEASVELMLDESFAQNVKAIKGFCSMANDIIRDEVSGSLNVAKMLIEDRGGIRISEETVEVEVSNQINNEVKTVALPELYVGDSKIDPVKSRELEVPIVDEVTGLVGGVCTIFQKMNDRGDMVRIASSATSEDGNRDIHGYIPIQTFGNINPILRDVLAGKIHHNSTFMMGEWFLTAYYPLFDNAGEIAGMLFVGRKREGVPSLRNNIDGVRVGEKGFVWIMHGVDALYEDKKSFVYIQDTFRGVADVSQMRDTEGRLVYATIRSNATGFEEEDVAIGLRQDEVASERFTWRGVSGDIQEHWVYYTYYQPWDWVIGLTGVASDFEGPYEEVDSVFFKMMRNTLIGAVVSLLLACIIATILGGMIARPITYITDVARSVANGNLKEASAMLKRGLNKKDSGFAELGKADDETGQLYRAFVTMIDNLNQLLNQLKQVMEQVVSASQEIAGNARDQQGNVQAFGTSSNQIAAAVKQISSTSKELLGTMGKVSDMANQSAGLAGDGRQHLEDVQSSIYELSQATQSVSRKLSIIAENADDINSVITTIAKVADHTNLLSLNAAIEAEKAGESGLGFSVVAREIRNLADQTADATLDIEEMVKGMQRSVTAGVGEMDEFYESVKKGVSNVADLNQQMDSILAQVQGLIPRFVDVQEGMQSQTSGADQIAEAVARLNQTAHDTSKSLQGFVRATEKLGVATAEMKEEMSHFKTTSSEDVTKK